MFKKLTFIVFLLGLSSLANAQRQRSCEIVFYGPEPPTECETIVDEEGIEIVSCAAVGAPPSRLLLDANNLSYSEANTELAEINFFGFCRCTIQLWSRPNFKGACLTYPFCRNKGHEIFTDQIWNKPNNSFRVRCKF